MLTHRFDASLAFACQAHRRQTRKGTDIPYIAHLVSVAAIVVEHGGDEDLAIAGLLHDAIEDQGGQAMADRIEAEFGRRVRSIVEECSDTDVEPKPEWRIRKETYIAGIAKKSEDAVLVSMADKLHNARAIVADYRQMGEALWPRFTGGREGTLWYYRTLADALARRRPGPLADELKRTVATLEELASGGEQVPSGRG